jgi:type I restriction enzyme S subunit
VSGLLPGWTHAPIEDLGELRLGKMLDKAKNQGLPAKYLRNINVRWFHFNLDDMHTIFVSPAEFEQLSVKDGDLFICEGGEPGRCAVWRGGDNVFVYQKALHRFRSYGGMVPELLMYRLRHDAETGALANAFTGTTIKHLTRKSLARLRVPVPPLPEQTRIADKLDVLLARVDACRERLDHVPAIVRRFRQSVLSAATSGELTREWREERGRDGEWRSASVADVASQVFDGPFGSHLKSKDYVDVGVRVVRLENIASLRFIEEKRTYISREKYEGLTKHTLFAGDILFSSFVDEEVRVCLLPEQLDGKAINKADCFCIRTKNDHCRSSFLVLRLACRSTFKALDEMVHGATRPRINLGQLREIAFELPPLDEQDEIVRRCSALFDLADALERRVGAVYRYADRITPSALAKAFRGELVQQDPNDELATDLLARIRAEASAISSPPPTLKSPTVKARGKIEVIVKKLIDVLSGSRNWMNAQDAFNECGIDDGSDTPLIESVYAELRELERAGLVVVEPVRDRKGRKIHDRLKLASRS